MRCVLAAIAGAALALLPTAPALAQDAGAYRALQQLDQKLFTVGWRLVTGNAAYCERTVPTIGVLLHDAATYPDPAEVRTALNLYGDVAVQAVAAGSPAARRGLVADATLTAVDQRALENDFPLSAPRWQRLADVNRALDTALARDGMVELAWSTREGIVMRAAITSLPGCLARFEVSGIGVRAVADGERVVFGDRFPGFAWPEEEFAAAVAHELAHNLLAHRLWLDRYGRSRANIRRTEEEADRLTPWLMANAGYDPAAAVRFMRRWGPQHDGGLLRKRTHAGWDERADAMAAELPLIAQSMADFAAADWRQRFRRNTGG